MAGGAFDPAEFAAFKSSAGRAPELSQESEGGGGFDPAEFGAFKANKAPGGASGRPTVGSPFRRESDAASFDERFGLGAKARATGSEPGLGEGLRREADERLVGKPSALNAAAVAAMRGGNAVGLNLPRNAGAAIASLPGIGNGRSFSQNYELAGEQEDALARQYPKTALAGTVAGIGAGAVALPSFKAAEGAGVLARAGMNALTGAGYGGAAEAIDKKTLGATAEGAALGGGLGAAGGYLVEKAAPVVMGLFRKGVPFRDATGQITTEAVDALRGAGINPAEITPELEQRLMASFSAKGPSVPVAREALAADQGITLSRGQATQDPRAVALETGAMSGGRGSRAQAVGQDFAQQQAGEIDAARGRLQTMAARGGDLVENPQAALEAAADRARAAGDAGARDVAAAQRARDEALQSVRGSAPGDALDGATAAVQGVRDAAEQGRSAYRQAYGEVAQIPGNFAPGALDGVRARVTRALGPDVPIDAVLTPAASRALSDLDNLPRILGLRDGETPTLQQIEQVRKRFSAYYGGTAQNPTDRRALNAVRDAFDNHVEDLLGIGQFGQRPAAPPAGRSGAVDDFPGLAAPTAAEPAGAAPAGSMALPQAKQGEPETLVRYLAKNGGIQLNDEARAADLHRLYVPGAGTLARHNGRSLDDLRVSLVEQGFFHPDEMGGVSARDVSDKILEAIRSERAGRPVYRVEDEARAGGQRALDRVSAENADHAALVDRQARRIQIDMEAHGLRPHELDRAALNDAAEAMVRGEADDAATAYDRAVSRMADHPAPAAATRSAAEEAPFPEIGEGVSPATENFPIGDTGPADAMRKARGLFRDYKQAFAPRGPGDVAGQRLQKIVDRDASTNEVVGMLFGTTTGRVSSGQLQTLNRIRSAVGADSDAWQAVQQGVIGRYLGGDDAGLGRRLDYLLRGEGRDLATGFLSEDQRRGLGALRGAVAAAERAHEAVPAWARGLERSGFDPNAIASSLFGSGVPGARTGALNEARAAKSFLGEDSAEWSGLRQAAVQKLTDPTMSAAKMVERIRGFTEGAGSGVAREMFTSAEIGHLRRFASALESTITASGQMRPDSGKAAGAVAKALDLLIGAVAFKVGGPTAAGTAYGARVGQRALEGGISAMKARGSFQGGAPRTPRPSVALPGLGQLGVGAGLGAGAGL